jgi:micrococcal nuclease
MRIRALRLFRRLAPRIAWFLLSLLGVLLFVILNRPGTVNKPELVLTSDDFRLVRRVVDGNTLLLESGERVRLIGVATPETRHGNRLAEDFGDEAAAFIQGLTAGKRVRLDFDPANFRRGHKDNAHQRATLAYVYLDDGRLLNSEIIKEGYGVTLTRYPFSRIEEFRRLEVEAREQRRGLWAGN